MPDARALAIRAPIPRSVGLVAWRGAGGDPRGDVPGHIPGEILSDIYAKVPTNVCRWMDPRSGCDGRVASTSSARLGGILGRLPIFPISWGNPVATEPSLPTSSPRRQSSRNLEAQSWIKALLAYTCILSRATFNPHTCSHARRRNSGHSHITHTSCPGSRLFGRQRVPSANSK